TQQRRYGITGLLASGATGGDRKRGNEGRPSAHPHPEHIEDHGERIHDGTHSAPIDIAPMDGDFGDTEMEMAGQVEQLHVECEPIDDHAVEEEASHGGVERLEAALRIPDSHLSQGVDVATERASHHGASEVVTLHARSGNRAGSYGQVGVL